MSTGGNHHNETSCMTKEGGCIRVPPWYPQGHLPLSEFPFMILQLQFVVVFLLTQGLQRFFFNHLCLPPLVSQLTVGLLLGPRVLVDRWKVLKTLHEIVFPKLSSEVYATIAILGLSLSLFIIAVKMDFSIIRKNGRKSIILGLLVLIVPSFVNIIVAVIYGHLTNLDEDQMRNLSSGASIIVLTAFPVIATLLSDLKLLNSELGRLALSIAIISEIASIFQIGISKALLALLAKSVEKKMMLLNAGGVVALLLALIFIIRPWMKYISTRTPKGRPVKDIYVLLVCTMALVGGLMTNACREFVFLGCFLVGASLPEGPPLGSAVVFKFESFILGMLLPFAITVSAMRADIIHINFNDKLLYGQALVTLSAFSTKILICLAFGLFYNMKIADALALGAILSSKGIVDLISYNMFYNVKMINDASFTFFILVATIASFIVPITVKKLYHPLRKYAGYQKRDIMHCKSDTPLRMLACIWRPENVSGITNLLSVSSITSENPMIVDVIHLIKLVGRCQPVFICHDLQQRKASNNMSSFSEDVFWALDKFEKANPHGLSMHLFTSVTPYKAMHEDICTLALDKLSSLIILPFHRKLSIYGGSQHAELEDQGQRVLNNWVLERAPCSVGILVDRGAAGDVNGGGEKEMVLVGVIFIGGSDDREAVSYAKRMARGGRVKVLVIRLIAMGEENGLSMMDSTALSGIEEFSASHPQFNYVDKVVNEGPDTARFLRSIVADFDLLIVGRRFDFDCTQTSGLKEWAEVPELGILGDLLASPDLHCSTSIFVIQQQKLWQWKDYAA